LPKKTFEAGADAKIDLITQLKDNQPTLHQQAKDLCASAIPLCHISSRDRGRNPQEKRSIAVFDAASAFTDTEWFSFIGAVIRVERDVPTRSASTGRWRRSSEIAFYLSSATITAARAANAIRDHWKTENTSHYSRDVTMGEDRSRIRITPGVLARLRSFDFNLIRSNRRSSLAQNRIRAAIGGLDRLRVPWH
jgi:predicted transposase YbfD/YdcC